MMPSTMTQRPGKPRGIRASPTREAAMRTSVAVASVMPASYVRRVTAATAIPTYLETHGDAVATVLPGRRPRGCHDCRACRGPAPAAHRLRRPGDAGDRRIARARPGARPRARGPRRPRGDLRTR